MTCHEADSSEDNIILSTHATFRWHQGLFKGLDIDDVKKFKPTGVYTIIDNLESIYARLRREHDLDVTLYDVMYGREEEILASQLVSEAVLGKHRHVVIGRGRGDLTVNVLARLMAGKRVLKVYPSFPMTHVQKNPELLREIDAFRNEMAREFLCYDPGYVDEFEFWRKALKLRKEGKRTFEEMIDGKPFKFKCREVIEVGKLIKKQIIARDYTLLDQSDVIVSLVPTLTDGTPALSSGVERELDYAHSHGRLTMVLWKPKGIPSPFCSEHLDKLVFSTPAAIKQLRGWASSFASTSRKTA